MTLRIGSLEFTAIGDRPELLADPVEAALRSPSWGTADGTIGVTEIDPELADTAAFCERYGVSPAESANCVVISGRRDGETRFAACVILATTRADVNNVARRVLDVRKASFAQTEVAVAQTGMEYGGITPVGLPGDWPILIDSAVAAAPLLVVGSGLRRSKLAVAGTVLAALPGAVTIAGLGR